MGKLKVCINCYEFQSRDPSGFSNPGKETSIFLSEGCLLPFTVIRNGLATIVATQLIATRNGLCYFCSSLIPIPSLSVVLVATTVVVVVVVFFSGFLAKMTNSDVSQKYDVILRNFKNLKHQNILAFTVWLIVPITLLILQNCQFGRLAVKISGLHFRPFWSNVTYSPDSPVNVPIESRNVRKIGTVSSNIIYKMHEITFIRVISTHCRI